MARDPLDQSPAVDSADPLAAIEAIPFNILVSTQWIELFNRNFQPYVMSGWTVETSSGIHPIPEIEIAQRDYIVLAWDPDYIRNIYPQIPVPVIGITSADGTPIGLNPKGDHILLRDPSGKVVSKISWGSDTTAFKPAAAIVAPGHSLARNPTGKETDHASDLKDLFPPTPGGPNAPMVLLSAPGRLPAQEATRDLFFAPITTPVELLATPVNVLVANILLVFLLALVFGTCGIVLDNLVRSQETTMTGLVARIPLMHYLFGGLEQLFGSSREAGKKHPGVSIAAAMIAYTLLACLLDPTWRPLGPGGIYLFVVMFGAILVAGWCDGVGQAVLLRHWRVPFRFDFWPANLLTGGGAVLVSRLIPMQPGILFGAPGGLRYNPKDVQGKRQDDLRWASIASMVLLILGSWTLAMLFQYLSLWVNGTSSTVTTPATIAVGFQNFFLAGFLGVLQYYFFNMIPVSTTYGHFAWRKKRWLWFVLFAPAAVVLSRILINPQDGPLTAMQARPVQVLLVVLFGYVVFTVVMWFYFTRHEDMLSAMHYREWLQSFRRANRADSGGK